MSQLVSISSIDDVLNHWDWFEKREFPLYGFFLYTDADKNFAKYVREHWWDLNDLTGERWLIFLIDQPPFIWNQSEYAAYWGRDWLDLADHETKLVSCSRPYRKEKAYEIARYMGIRESALPCIVFFQHVDAADTIVYSLSAGLSEDEITQEMRGLFAVVGDFDLPGERWRVLRREAPEKAARVSTQMWRCLEAYVVRQNRIRRLEATLTNPAVATLTSLLSTVAGWFGMKVKP